MFYLKCKSWHISSEKAHIHECMCQSKEVAEALVKSWQANKGKDFKYKIVELREVNPKRFKNLGLYMNIHHFIIPKD